MKKIIAALLVVVCVFTLVACDSKDYEKANTLFAQGQYDEARAIYVELGDYEDSAEKIKACDYAKATQLMEAGEAAQAAELFEALGDYVDSADLLVKCRTQVIDALLQGTWKNTALWTASIGQQFTFENGRVTADMLLNGKVSLSNVGDYRIALDEQIVYVCYDYIISTTGKTPNTEEKKLFNFTYDGETFVLKMDSTDNLMEKK